jgi:hypothetical protein
MSHIIDQVYLHLAYFSADKFVLSVLNHPNSFKIFLSADECVLCYPRLAGIKKFLSIEIAASAEDGCA